MRWWARSWSASWTRWGAPSCPRLLREFLPPQFASALGPALASILIYVLMAAILFWKPQGLFPARG